MSNQRYRAFSVAAEEGSFLKAAEVMNYTTPAVSQLVMALEKEMGFPLLTRHRRGVTLTREGEKVLPVIRELLRQEDRLEEVTAEINGLTTGEISIGAYSSVAAHWLPALIREFTELYPGIRISMMEGIRQENIRWLENRTIDMSFLAYWDGMKYDWFRLADDPMIAVLPKSHLRAGDGSYPLAEAEKESFIMPALGRDLDVVDLIRKNGLELNITFTTLENFSALSLIEQGLGMSVMNYLITHNFEADVVKLPLDPPHHLEIGIAIPSYENASPAVRRFTDFCVKRLRK